MSTFVRPSWTGFGRAALLGVMFALAGAASDASAQSTADKYQNRRSLADLPRARFSLHAEPTVVLQANQFQCGLVNTGDTCTDIFDSPTGAGGFWPTGSPNAYMFNSGIMIAGIIPQDAGFEWAGDTTGAYFFDALGTQQHGTPITNIYNSLDPADLEVWPSEGSIPDFPFATAYIVDEEIFSTVLTRGGPGGTPRATGSQQDTWVMYWDGDPGLSANRDHPLGVTIEQRTMAWNFPSGNEATIYIFYKITNVTNNEEFQTLNEQRFGIPLPDGGWAFDSLYIAYGADPDVTADATENFASVILPFNMGITYHALFTAAEFSYPPSLFYPPFFTQAPGIVGVQYLKSPVDPNTGEEVGLTMFSVHENPGSCNGLCDPTGDKQLWRYLSGNVNPGLGDPSCSFTNPQEGRICYLPQQPADARFFQASGPFSLLPGQSTTVVVGMMAAATVNTPEITIGAENPPQIPGLRPGCGDDILPIEVAAGWASTPVELCTADPDGPLDLREIETVPASLLGRAQVAQAVFDGKFLLPFAPEAPPFYLVPGDDQVSIVWEPSLTEEMTVTAEGDTLGGDPFYNIASAEFTEEGDPNPLYNPNYRRFDVEGYRIYRSTDNSNFDLVAQFDYNNTEFVDVRCEANREFVPGEDDEADCDEEHIAINDITDLDADFVIDPFVLFGGPDAQRLRLADGRTLAIRGDSASSGGFPDLTDSGVPFVFVDTDVRNGFRYFYQVRAYDINSTFSGPISLESSSETKNVIPRASTIDPATAEFTVALVGTDGEPIANTGAEQIDPATGRFLNDEMPATNGIEVTFLPFAPDLLAPGVFDFRVDSVTSGYYGGTYYFTGPDGNQFQVASPDPSVTAQVVTTPLGPFSVPADSALAAAQADEGGDPPPNAGAIFIDILLQRPHWASSMIDWTSSASVTGFWANPDPGTGAIAGGSRWFVGDNETVADPTLGTDEGEIPGMQIFHPQPFNGELVSYTNPVNGADVGGDIFRRFYQATFATNRAADMEVRWATPTTIEGIFDVTHNVPVPFDSMSNASYGFVTDADGDGVLTFGDFYYITGLNRGGTGNIGNISTTFPTDLVEQPVRMQVDIDGDLDADGEGFALYLAGHPVLMVGTPAAGDVWTLRSHFGTVNQTGGVYSFAPTIRNPSVPGLILRVEVLAPAVFDPGAVDLTEVHTIPDPYYAQSLYDLSPVEKALRFVNLPPQATIRIYTVSGLLVDVLNHSDPTGGGLTTWDLKNRSGQFVASGVYFFHVSTPDGNEHIGRFTVINSGIGQ